MNWLGAIRTSVVTLIVLVLAAASSGALPFSTPSQPASASIAAGWTDLDDKVAQIPGDNAELCSPRHGPKVRTSVHPSGALQVTITAATGFDGFPIALRRLRIGPSQNAAVSIGPHVGRSDPFFHNLVGVQEVTFTASRVTPGQPLHIPLIVFDDCEEWHTFAGAGTGVALPAVVPTATTIPCLPGQVCGSIPIGVGVTPRSFAPGSRVRVTIDTRPGAACELRVTHPGQPVQSLGAMTANSTGGCPYNVFVPFGLPFGNGSFTGIVQDAFGTNIRVVSFTIGDFSGDNIQGDAGISFWDDDASNENRADNGNENERDNEE